MYAAVAIIPATSSLSQTRPIFHGVRYYIAYSTSFLNAFVARRTPPSKRKQIDGRNVARAKHLDPPLLRGAVKFCVSSPIKECLIQLRGVLEHPKPPPGSAPATYAGNMFPAHFPARVGKMPTNLEISSGTT